MTDFEAMAAEHLGCWRDPHDPCCDGVCGEHPWSPWPCTKAQALADLLRRVAADDPYEPIAEAILTSTDPAVHAALLAALVRAGVALDRDDRERAEGAADGIEGLMHELACHRDAELAARRADQWRAQARATGADQ